MFNRPAHLRDALRAFPILRVEAVYDVIGEGDLVAAR
jgi:hypothetical protein